MSDDIVRRLRSHRDSILEEAAAEIETLRRAVYKMQMPHNQNKFPTEFLSSSELQTIRRAVSESI